MKLAVARTHTLPRTWSANRFLITYWANSDGCDPAPFRLRHPKVALHSPQWRVTLFAVAWRSGRRLRSEKLDNGFEVPAFRTV